MYMSMNNFIRICIASIIAIVAFSACEQKGATTENFKPGITGKNGEVLVIINDDIKRDTAGRYISYMFNEPVLGLTADEPIFDLQTVPHGFFNENMQVFRNIVDVVVADTVSVDTVRFYNDVWATPQAFVSFQAKSKKALLELAQRHHVRVLSFLCKAERDRIIAFNKRTQHLELSDNMCRQWSATEGNNYKSDVSLCIPNTFKRCVPHHPDQITWARIDNDEMNINLMVYDIPYVGEGSLSLAYILDQRDKKLIANIEGPQGSYMCTDVRYGLDEVNYFGCKFKGMDAAELRGRWHLEGYPMGGPFILRAHHDTISNRIVVTDGWVYYPSRDRKRNLIRQLEAIMYSLNIKPAEDK